MYGKILNLCRLHYSLLPYLKEPNIWTKLPNGRLFIPATNRSYPVPLTRAAVTSGVAIRGILWDIYKTREELKKIAVPKVVVSSLHQDIVSDYVTQGEVYPVFYKESLKSLLECPVATVKNGPLTTKFYPAYFECTHVNKTGVRRDISFLL